MNTAIEIKRELLAAWFELGGIGRVVDITHERLATGELLLDDYIAEMLSLFANARAVMKDVAVLLIGPDRTNEVLLQAEDDVDPTDPRDAAFRAGARWVLEHRVPSEQALDLALASMEMGCVGPDNHDPRDAVRHLVEALVAEWRGDLEYAIEVGRKAADPLTHVLGYVRGEMGERLARAMTARMVQMPRTDAEVQR